MLTVLLILILCLYFTEFFEVSQSAMLFLEDSEEDTICK